MKKDAEAHADEDRRRREEIELRNQADSLAYTAEKTVREAGDKIPADVRGDIEARVKEVRDALAAQADTDRVRTAVNALSEALQRAGAAVYGAGAQAGPEAGPPPEGEAGAEGEGEGPAEEGTVEGEYREV